MLKWRGLLYRAGELGEQEICELREAVLFPKMSKNMGSGIPGAGIGADNGFAEEPIRFLKISPEIDVCRMNELLAAEGLAPAECLMVAATDQSLEFARSCGIAPLAYQPPSRPRQRFEGEKMLVEGFAEVDRIFLRRQYERYHGIPWTIAETERCVIRELTLSDIPALFDLYAQPHVTDYMEPLFEEEKEIEYQKAYIENIYHYYGFGMWLVFEKETGRLVGRAGLELRDYQQPQKPPHEEDMRGEVSPDSCAMELGYVISPQFQRQGYATEVCRRIIKYAEEELDAGSIHCMIRPQNIPSIALARKLGFVFVDNVCMNQVNFAHYILSYNC